jgi:hypothetical protein
MKTISSIKFLLICLAMLLVAMPVSSVAAESVVLTPPIPPNAQDVHCSTSSTGTVCHWTALFGTPSTGVPYGYVACNGASVIVNLQGEMRVNAFYDESGQLELLKRHISYSGTLSSPVTGTSVPHEGHATLTFDYQTNTTTITGLYHATVLPEGGKIFSSAGIIVLAGDGSITFVAGPHDYHLGETEQLCTALS